MVKHIYISLFLSHNYVRLCRNALNITCVLVVLFLLTFVCLLTLTDDLYNGLDLDEPVGIVFSDLKKTFNSVDGKILYQKTEIYGTL